MSVCDAILTLVAQNKSGAVIPRLIGQSYLGITKNLIDIAAALAAILVVQSVDGQQAAGLDRLLATPPLVTEPDTETRMLDL